MRKSNNSVLACYGKMDMQDSGIAFPLPPAGQPSLEQNVLNEIFKFDDDGIFQADLAMFNNANVRPEIRDFITNNLMKMQSVSSPVPEGLSDEEISVLTPNPFDTLSSYQDRVSEYFKVLNEQHEEG